MPSFDDGKVLPGEKLWRLIDPSWYQVIDPQVGPEVLDAAFKGEVSLLRESMVWDYIVDTARNGKFKKWGNFRLTTFGLVIVRSKFKMNLSGHLIRMQ